ncbi:hypothetical protein KDL01_37295 [Actinospica durhamensis]|uniref:Uncharacterized protein n=1 Tax=Actinospica durhamensis TaxID=1508375 RepID=A0A941F199_9ACTN|nr:hypothetical protein [Actinospica durhamensis]MBR7838984.1 hypothetical protein [Actinospica durhamensis]
MNHDDAVDSNDFEDCGDSGEDHFHHTRARFIARNDQSFDFPAGLADVFTRAVRADDAICRQVDRLLSILSLLEPPTGAGPSPALAPAPSPAPAAEHVRQARELIIEFRSIIAATPRPHPDRARLGTLLASVSDHLESAALADGIVLMTQLDRIREMVRGEHTHPDQTNDESRATTTRREATTWSGGTETEA